MFNRILFLRIVPFLVLSLGLAAATVLGDWLLHRFGMVHVGRYLGIAGVVLIAMSFLYSLRKRKRILWGSPTRLLAFHESAAWLGSWLVLLHAGVHFNSWLAWLATVAMGINVLSGLTGKILLKSSRQLVSARRQALLAAGLSADQADAQLHWDSAAVRVMNQWRRVHIPVFVSFVVLAFAHIVSTLLFWGWR